MSNVIYYFTSTGNSLVFARNLAAALGETEIVSMPKVMSGGTANSDAQPIKTEAERVGVVFPVYAWGPPRTVKDFLGRLKVSPVQYVFAVATCGGTPGNTLVQARDALRRHGGHLDAGFVIREPSYMGGDGNEPGIIKLMKWAAGGVRPDTGQNRLREIADAVKAESRLRLETSKWLANLIGGTLSKMSSSMMAKADKDYHVNSKCVSCGTCERVCPRGNVRLVDGKPKWHGDCQMCQTCLQWCPQGAIVMGNGPEAPRSHHSGVTLSDIIVR